MRVIMFNLINKQVINKVKQKNLISGQPKKTVLKTSYFTVRFPFEI